MFFRVFRFPLFVLYRFFQTPKNGGIRVRVRLSVYGGDRENRRDDARPPPARPRGCKFLAETWRPPEPYELVCSAHVPSAFATERALHTILGARRINARREFFRASFVEARNLFALLAEGCSSQTSQPPAGEGPVVAVVDAAHISPERIWASPRAPLGAVGVPGQSQLRQEACLRSWVESNYTHVPLREKDTGSKLEILYVAYTTCVPPVHAKVLGKILFAKMLNAVYPNIGPHKNTTSSGFMYLLK